MKVLPDFPHGSGESSPASRRHRHHRHVAAGDRHTRAGDRRHRRRSNAGGRRNGRDQPPHRGCGPAAHPHPATGHTRSPGGGLLRDRESDGTSASTPVGGRPSAHCAGRVPDPHGSAELPVRQGIQSAPPLPRNNRRTPRTDGASIPSRFLSCPTPLLRVCSTVLHRRSRGCAPRVPPPEVDELTKPVPKARSGCRMLRMAPQHVSRNNWEHCWCARIRGSGR